MVKNFIIVGGGISGLTALHYLSKRFASDREVKITLLEKESSPGGTISTIRKNNIQFETGPNGFLDSKSSTLQLARDIGLEKELITASPQTKIRYIAVNDRLYALPTNPKAFSTFPLLTLFDKLRVLKEIVISKGVIPTETVYEFGNRRLGTAFTKYFLSPMVSGIFGGDARQLNLKFAFPRIYEIEQKYGSLIKGMIALGIKKQKQRRSLPTGQPAGQLWSLKKGMGQLVETLAEKYANSIIPSTPVESITYQNSKYLLKAGDKEYLADKLILSVPAHVASKLISEINTELSQALNEIEYAAIIVVGLTYTHKQIQTTPNGFGYLRAEEENSVDTVKRTNESLGVLYSSQIYPQRCPDRKYLFQIMIGGARHPEALQKSDEDLYSLAHKEIETHHGAQGMPIDKFLIRWEKGIPQYNRSYPQTYEKIKENLSKNPDLYLLANYLDGVALNNCTENARKLAETIKV